MRWLALFSVVAGLGVLHPVEAASSPSAVVLRLSDLGQGYTQDKAARLSVKYQGQRAGYETSFSRQTSAASSDIDDVAWAYTTDTYAFVGYRRSITGVLAQHPFAHTVWHPMVPRSVGDMRVAYRASGRDRAGPVSYAVVVFARGAIVAAVTLVVGGRFTDSAQLFALAAIMDRRMRE